MNDILICDECFKLTTQKEAELRKFNTGRCGHCGGLLAATYLTCDEHGEVTHDLAPGEADRIVDYGICDPCRAARGETIAGRWLTLIIAAIVIIVLIILSGCEVRQTDPNQPEVKFTQYRERHFLTKSLHAEVFYLDDGTKCVALIRDFDAASLSCRWIRDISGGNHEQQPERATSAFRF